MHKDWKGFIWCLYLLLNGEDKYSESEAYGEPVQGSSSG